MAMTINTNIQSLNAQRNLGTSQSSLSTSMQRLSSGMRINSAKDDAAGLAIAERMSAQIKGLNQAARNANDGVSLAQTAEGALSTIGGNLQRIRELAVQSRNATNSVEDRGALQKEVQQLKDEIGRVAKDTAFNGTNLLDGSFNAKAFQVGANQGQTISIDSIQNASVSQLGSWKSVDVPATIVGNSVVAGTVTPSTSAAGSYTAPTVASGGTAKTQTLTVAGIELVNNTIAVPGTGTNSGLLAADIDAAIASKASKLAEKGITYTGSVANNNLVFKDASGAALTATASTDMGFSLTAGPAGVTAFPPMSFTVKVGSGTEATITTTAQTSQEAFGKELTDKISAALPGQVTASFSGGKLSLSANADVTLGGADLDKVGLKAGTTDYKVGKSETGFDKLTVATAEDADNAILAMDAALKSVNSARADLGAMQNRFESVVSNLNVNSENLSASKSRITDADFAAETANLSRSQILQQAGTAMVAQANQLPQGVLSLLR